MQRYLTICLLTLGLAPGANSGSPAQDPDGWHFTKFDFPGAFSTDGYGISSTGEMTGGYFYADGHQHGWRRTRGGTFTSIDFPGSDFTKAFQSNSRGDLVGNYSFNGDPVERHGYLLRDGRFTTFDPPGSFKTQPYGINDRGEITGRYCVVQGACDDGSGNFHGFLRTRRGEYITIDFPGGYDTACFKSNSRGDIVGGYSDSDGKRHVFILSDGHFTKVHFPGAFETGMFPSQGAINSHGDIVSWYCDANPCTFDNGRAHGFLRSHQGKYTTIDFPGAATTYPTGITARGDIEGLYHIANGVDHAFLLRRGDRDYGANEDDPPELP
jgi:hypothetical protein